MGTLSGNRIKSTYQGLLKTTDAANLTSSLKVIEDGSGNSSALSLSTTEVKVAGLKIGSGPTSLATGTETDVLIIASDGTIKKRAFPSASTVTTSTSGTASPQITVAKSTGSSKTVTFNSGGGITLSRNSATDTITIAADSAVPTMSTLTTTAGVQASDGSVVYLLDVNSINGGTISLPSISAAGDNLKFVVSTEKSTAMTIKSASGDKFFGKVTLDKSDGSSRAIQNNVKSGSNNTITLAATSASSGGKAGDVIECIAVDTEFWLVNANLTTTGAATSCDVFSTT